MSRQSNGAEAIDMDSRMTTLETQLEQVKENHRDLLYRFDKRMDAVDEQLTLVRKSLDLLVAMKRK